MTLETAPASTAPAAVRSTPAQPSISAAEEPRGPAPRMDTACYRDTLISSGVIPDDPGADFSAFYG